MKTTAMWMAALALGAGCGKKAEDGKPSGSKSPPTVTKEPAKTAADAGATQPSTPTGDELVLDSAGFDTPESVLYDPTADVYLVSNIGGSPTDKDDNAFISRVDPTGKVELRWIDSAHSDVELDAPKGSAILGDLLYVADIDVVRMFDRTSGGTRGEIAIPGASFLNDVAASGDTIWVTDTGVKAGAGGLEPSGTDAVYTIDTKDGNKVTKVVSGKELGNPNGIAVSGDRVAVVTFGSGEMYDLVQKDGGWSTDRHVKLPKGQLDGIVILGDRTLVSSWEGQAVYAVGADGKAAELFTGLEAPADIGFDTKRHRLLIPLFTKSSVTIRAVE
jgi:hypothetical protein